LEREGLAGFGGGGELVGGSAVEGAGGEDVASVVGWVGAVTHLLSQQLIDAIETRLSSCNWSLRWAFSLETFKLISWKSCLERIAFLFELRL